MADRTMTIVVDLRPLSPDERDRAADYALSALTYWGGQFPPEDELFEGLIVKRIYTNSKNYVLPDKNDGPGIVSYVPRR